MSYRTQFVACFIKQLCRERTATDTCTICLEDTVYLTDITRRDTQSRTASGTDRVGRCHERIRTEVDVQHSALCTFRQDRLTVFQEVVYHMFAVDQVELLQVFQCFKPLGFEFLDIIRIVQ